VAVEVGGSGSRWQWQVALSYLVESTGTVEVKRIPPEKRLSNTFCVVIE
jgi:hypothetical protein